MTYNISPQLAQPYYSYPHMLYTNALHSGCNSGCKPVHISNISANKSCLIDHIPTHIPYIFNSCHNHHGLSHNHHDYDLCHSSHGSHDAAWVNSHDAGNTLVLNMCTTPCNWGVGGKTVQPDTKGKIEDVKKPSLDLGKLAIITNAETKEILKKGSNEGTGQFMDKCAPILLAEAEKGALFSENMKIMGKCSEANKGCIDCMKAINLSIEGEIPESYSSYII